MGYVDEDGFLYLVDRKKDMIISGGVNVYPRDIEEVMVKHPAVREAAVFGAPSDKWGESPVAAVVCKPGARVTAEALRAWTNERVEAKYQRVSAVMLVADLPRGVTGKVLQAGAARGPRGPAGGRHRRVSVSRRPHARSRRLERAGHIRRRGSYSAAAPRSRL